MFQVTTVLPEAHEPISKALLVDKLKTPKPAEEVKATEEAKKKDKKKEGLTEEELYNFTPIPLE